MHSIFPFPVTTARGIGKWKNNRQCATIWINIGGSLHPAPVGNAPRTQVCFRGFCKVLGAWPTGAASIVAPIVLGLHNEQKILCSTLPIVLHLAYFLSCTGGKRKKIPYKMEAQ